MPLAAAIGVTVAHIDRVVTADGPRWRVAFTICALTISATVASAVVAVFLGSTVGQLAADTAPTLIILVIAAAAYCAVASLIGAAGVAGDRGIVPAYRDIVHGQRSTFPANVALGLAVAIVLAIDPRWLVALVPVVVILHRAYVNQAEVDDGSLWWENLAVATRGLSHPAAVDVVAAALRSAKMLFGADEVQVGLHCEAAGADHAWTWYGSDGVASVMVSTPLTGPQIVARPLVADEASLGEIRLRLNRARRLDQAGDLVLSTFATERVMLTDPDKVQQAVAAVRELGVPRWRWRANWTSGSWPRRSNCLSNGPHWRRSVSCVLRAIYSTRRCPQ